MKINGKIEVIHKPTIFLFLRHYIGDHFPGFSVSYTNTMLTIEGKLSDSDWESEYCFQIKTTLTKSPKTYVLSPTISPNLSIHMYPDCSLCLYHPADLPYNYNFTYVSDIIPWLVKWVHYYEIWLRNGNIWIGPEAPHP
jgi:hypothetical protein